jgi:hypothetical protein
MAEVSKHASWRRQGGRKDARKLCLESFDAFDARRDRTGGAQVDADAIALDLFLLATTQARKARQPTAVLQLLLLLLLLLLQLLSQHNVVSCAESVDGMSVCTIA